MGALCHTGRSRPMISPASGGLTKKQAHLRRLEGTVVRDHRRLAAIRGAREIAIDQRKDILRNEWRAQECWRDHAVRRRPAALKSVLRRGLRRAGGL